MTFAAPLLLAGLLLVVPVLLAFLVRRRRDVIAVSSTFLFRQLGTARSRSKRLRFLTRLLALLACVIAVTALVVAGARPAAPPSGSTTVVVVDVSASMGDGSRGTPLWQARRYLGRRLLRRGRGDRIAIVASGATARHLAGPTASGEVLRRALAELEATTGAADLTAALDLATGLVALEPRPEVLVLHDGGAGPSGVPDDLRGAPLFERRFLREDEDNLGIAAFATRPMPGAGGPAERQALVTIANASTEPRAGEVVVEGLGVTLATRRVEIPPKGEVEVEIGLTAPAESLTARIRSLDGREEALSSDDSSHLEQRTGTQRRALVVTTGEDATAAFFVEKALRSAGVETVEMVSPDAEEAFAVGEEDVVVVLDRAPERPVEAPTLYLATRSGRLPFGAPQDLTAEGGGTLLRSVDDRSPLLDGVDFQGVTIDHALATSAPDDGRALVSLDGGDVVLMGGAGRSAWVFAGLDPTGSDLVLRVAFPVLVANALAVLGGSANVSVAATVPRSEVTLRRAPALRARTAEELPFSLPFSPAVLLAAMAVVLLGAELFFWRKGWAS